MLHVRPASGWLNDPNGPVRWRGRWHLFFQHNPDAPVHGQICWGHASSTDLVSWELGPVALRPTPGSPDAAGCWSGCIVIDDDRDHRAVAVYTGVDATPELGSICLATSTDDALERWVKRPTPVAEAPSGLVGFRDPFVFNHDGHRYALVGAGHEPGGRPSVLVYGCDDLTAWEPLGVLVDGADPTAGALAPADVWECPQLVELDGRWVLLVSLAGLQHLGRVAYLVGDLRVGPEGPRFVPSAGGLVDHGHDFYAPAVLATPDRVLLWGWSWEDQPEAAVLAAGRAGCLTLTRELSLRGDVLVSRPVPELAARHASTTTAVLDPDHPRLELPRGPLDLLVALEPGTCLELMASLRLEHAGDTFRVGKAVHDPHRQTWDTSVPGGRGDDVHLRVVVDDQIIEVYLADGPTFTERVPTTRHDLRLLSPTGRGEVVVRCLA